jgi:iron complex transport system ATP-binding protein
MKNQKVILEAKDLSIGYALKNEVNVLAASINFSLPKGEMVSILGPNGVGKSTLIKTILGQIPALSGTITLENKPLHQFKNSELSQKIAVVLTDKIRLSTLTVKELIELGRVPHTNWLGKLSKEDIEQVDYALASTQTTYIQDQPLNQISDGQLQKTMIARALAQNGDLLILDEPAAHLDLISRFEIMQLLQKIAKEKNKAVLVVTHDLENAIETSDKIWLMQCGHDLISGTPEDLVLNGKINLLFGSHTMKLDVHTGKTQTEKPSLPMAIKGPEHCVKWVKQALQKNPHLISLGNIQEIITEDAPFKIHVITKRDMQTFESIEEMLGFYQ